jgi:predicted nucleic acid-binding protein
MTLVVDASVAAKWFVEETGRPQAMRLLDVPDRQAPDLLIVEVANVIWKKTLRGQVSALQGHLICASIADYFEVVHSAASLIERAIAIANLLRHPIYDCLYLACAERTGARLATVDRRLITAVQGSVLSSLVLDIDDLA